MSVVPPPERVAFGIVVEVRSRRSAVPEGGDAPPARVVMSTTRKRSWVMGAPVLFVNLRRIESVPSVELFGMSGVGSRKRAQASPGSKLVPEQPASTSEALTCALRWTGLVKLSGPGAPCVDAVELNVPPVVETKTKSLALLLVSCGKP